MATDAPTTNDDRLLFELKSRGPQAAATLAAALAITPMGAHKLLARLEELGLVTSREDTRNAGEAARIGRPRKLWALTGAGHARFPDRHADLTLQLIQNARQLFGEAGLDQLITAREQDSVRRYAAALSRAQSLAERVRELARLRSEEGYMARAERSGRDWLLVEDHCPICAAATSCQGFCRSELALFQRSLGPGVTVERTEHLVAGARRCVYRIAAPPPSVTQSNVQA